MSDFRKENPKEQKKKRKNEKTKTRGQGGGSTGYVYVVGRFNFRWGKVGTMHTVASDDGEAEEKAWSDE